MFFGNDLLIFDIQWWYLSLKAVKFNEAWMFLLDRAPTHAGGLFAIDRAYFLEIGAYDPGLLVWGGENFELSFKVSNIHFSFFLYM